MKFLTKKTGFTLIELLIALGIVAALSTVVIITLNPAELLAQSRDATRISDLETINSALRILEADVKDADLGDLNVVYISIPDSSPTCANVSGLPTLASSTYHCAPESDYRNVNGTGWIPVNFTTISFNSPLTKLPVDPINNSGCGLFYAYVPHWEISAALQSIKYREQVSNYGTSTVFMMGKSPESMPIELISRACTNGPGSGPGDNNPEAQYACSGTSCVATSGGPFITSDCNSACSIMGNDKYSCTSGTCAPDSAGSYSDSTCGGACTATYFACSNNACVASSTGTFTSATCGGTCVAPGGGEISASLSTFEGDRPTYPADNLTLFTGTARILDTEGSPIEGAELEFTNTGTNLTTTEDTITGSGASSGYGLVYAKTGTPQIGVEFSVRARKQGGEWVSITQKPTVNFTNPPHPDWSYAYLDRYNAPANGTETIDAHLYATDSEDNPVANALTSCTIFPGEAGGTIIGDEQLTDAEGSMSCSAVSTVPGNYTMSVFLSGNLILEEIIAFTEMPASGTVINPNSPLTYNENSAPANGESFVYMVFQIQDMSNAPIRNAEIECMSNGTDINFDYGYQKFSNSDGETSCMATSQTVQGNITFSAKARINQEAWVNLNPTITGEFTQAAYGPNSSMTISTTTTPGDGQTPVIGTVTALDSENNPVNGAEIQCLISDEENDIYFPYVYADENGVATCEITNSGIGIYEVGATVDGMRITADETIEFTLPSGYNLIFSRDKTIVLNEPEHNSNTLYAYLEARDYIYDEQVPDLPVECELDPPVLNAIIQNGGTTEIVYEGPSPQCSIEGVDVPSGTTSTLKAYILDSPGGNRVQQAPDSYEVTFTNRLDPTYTTVNFSKTFNLCSEEPEGPPCIDTMSMSDSEVLTAEITAKDENNNNLPKGYPISCSTGSSQIQVTLSRHHQPQGGLDSECNNGCALVNDTGKAYCTYHTPEPSDGESANIYDVLNYEALAVFNLNIGASGKPTMSWENSPIEVSGSSQKSINTPFQVDITIKDVNNSPLAGVTVRCQVDGNLPLINAVDTDINGQTSCTVTGTELGYKTIQAYANGQLIYTSIEFIP